MRAIFYMHTGSANHGCEAIVRSSYDINKEFFSEIELFSKCEEEDFRYLYDLGIKIQPSWYTLRKKTFSYVIMALRMKLLKQKNAYIGYQYKPLLRAFGSDMLAFSIGGDNYCYDGMPELLARLNETANKKGAKTILWGASIEPELLKNKKIREDIKRYALIIVRESITYNALLDNGIEHNVKLYPDPAFTLQRKEIVLPEGLNEREFVGLNLSPLVMNCNEDLNIAYRNFENLIQHIIEKMKLNIALIPHVIWKGNDDREPLTKLYERYKHTERVYLIEDMDAAKLKGIISKCKYFIGARTHATIAAYSTHVPTLVVGYSVKARGIAKDIFGTEEGYVLPVQELENENALINGFSWLIEHEEAIREKLECIMPDYVQKAASVKEEIKKLVTDGR